MQYLFGLMVSMKMSGLTLLWILTLSGMSDEWRWESLYPLWKLSLCECGSRQGDEWLCVIMTHLYIVVVSEVIFPCISRVGKVVLLTVVVEVWFVVSICGSMWIVHILWRTYLWARSLDCIARFILNFSPRQSGCPILDFWFLFLCLSVVILEWCYWIKYIFSRGGPLRFSHIMKI